ncbi:batten's disease protein Cln3 [Xylona heveae TC161]|uniref:Protein BTN n=1 Tax=Xylona heveae (strain CBS 132557 / TC161) TaxID=1328760 RepID=A0A165A347_XYLHT|nr:batten's disease protein Cln3 [Xylona heveae TC161]KZF19888.1 batten's disease protein Cln3 [Xylona heveae TC161]
MRGQPEHSAPSTQRMLPVPGSPAASWPVYKERLRRLFEGADKRVCIAFWLFGLINNVLYVIILSSALDLVGPRVPKGVVLLADVLPSFFTKLVAPYFIHAIPYSLRIVIFACLSSAGMLIIAVTPTTTDRAAIATKMVGVALASLSSGGGELSFLGLTHYYGHFSLAAWGSGTGGAGLIGAGAYVAATTWLGLGVKKSILVFACLPVIMLMSFFIILPRGPLKYTSSPQAGYESIAREDTENELPSSEPEGFHGHQPEQDPLMQSPQNSAHCVKRSHQEPQSILSSFKANLRRARGLFFPYMLPLLMVYIAEYTINQGVAPTLLFPLKSTPFTEYRDFYPTYNAMYQVGVFISRSSTPFFRVHSLYAPSLLQILNLLLLTLHALFDFIPNVYIIFAIIFWEGLLGGLVYVNTFAEITDHIPEEDREFSLGATSVSDSGGICIAGFLGMVFEVWLCDWQISRGRPYCRKE